MNRDASVHEHADWDRQQEALSSYVDGELPAAEREQMERHLAECTVCQQALSDMRRVRALLRALPEPSLPRSFLLPEEEPLRAEPNLPVAPARASRLVFVRFARAMQAVGGVAAAAGLVLVLSGVVSGLGSHVENSTASYAPATGASQVESTGTPDTSSLTGRDMPSATTDARTSTAPQQNQARVMPTATPQSEQPTPAAERAVPLLSIGGTGLMLGGIALVVAGYSAQRKRQARQRPTSTHS